LHDQKCVVHRDIKLENLMLDLKDVPLADNLIKLIDFGFARRFLPGCNDLHSKCGTPWYMAPETISGEYNEKCDVYSSGVVLYALLSGEMPFDDDDPEVVLQKATDEHVTFDLDAFHVVSPLAKVLLAELLNKHVEKRPSARTAYENQWMQQESPTHKLDCKEAKAVVGNLCKFRNQNTFKRKAMMVVAHYIDTPALKATMESFRAVDEDNTGMILVEELDGALAKAGLCDADQAKVKRKLQGYYSSCKTYISYSEFIAASLLDVKNLQKAACWEAFRVFDQDNDGVISLEEFKRGLSEGGEFKDHISDEEAERIFHEVDTKGCNQIDFEEFMEMLQGSTIDKDIRDSRMGSWQLGGSEGPGYRSEASNPR